MKNKVMSPPTVICCFGKSASSVTKLISIIDMVIFSICFLLVGFATACYLIQPDTVETVLPFLKKDVESYMKLKEVYRLYILISLLVWSFGEVGFGLLLFFGTRKHSYAMLRAWIFLIIVDCLFAMVAFIQLVVSTAHFIFFIVLSIIYYSYRVLSLWTVHLVLREVVSQIEWV